MPSWDAEQYLKFADERTRPCRELAARVAIDAPRRVIDLGCGSGNSTRVLAERWPAAEVTGLDSSAQMIAAARRENPAGRWIEADIAGWHWQAQSASGEMPTDVNSLAGTGRLRLPVPPKRTDLPGRPDIIFSNAALQWVPDHAALLPRLLRQANPGGALAVQMPDNFDAPAHRAMRELAASAGWRELLFQGGGVREWHVDDLPFYYDTLAPHAARLDLWKTEYFQVMPDAEGIVAWYRGTGLRPFLDALPTDADRDRFAAEYLERIRAAYPRRTDGRVLFPFRRLFLIAYRGE